MLSLLLTACLSVHLPEPNADMVALAQRERPDASLDSLAAGRALVLKRCAGCHRPPEPAMTADEDWPELLEQMGRKARLGPEDTARIDAYLRASAALPPPTDARR
jgi:mono/diheme cytochrome c family protein